MAIIILTMSADETKIGRETGEEEKQREGEKKWTGGKNRYIGGKRGKK